MSDQDERLKAQERRNRQMARGFVNMPPSLVMGSQQMPTARAEAPANTAGRASCGRSPARPSESTSDSSTARRDGSPGASSRPSIGASERNKQRMEEERRIKAQSRQGRALSPVRLPPGSGSTQPRVTVKDPQQGSKNQMNRNYAPPTSSATRATTAPIRLPSDLRAGMEDTTPSGEMYHVPKPKMTTVIASRMDAKDQERQARDLVRGVYTPPTSSASRATTAPVRPPSDLRGGMQDATPYGEMSNVPKPRTTTAVASGMDIKDQERQARDLVHGTFAPPPSAASRSTTAPVRLPSDLRAGMQDRAPSGEIHMPSPERQARASASARVTGKPLRMPSHGVQSSKPSLAPSVYDELNSAKEREREARERARMSAGGATRGRGQQQDDSDLVYGEISPPSHMRASTTPFPTQEQQAANPTNFQRSVSDEQHANNRIAEEERIKRRERDARVTTVANAGLKSSLVVDPGELANMVPQTTNERAVSTGSAVPLTTLKGARTLGGHGRRVDEDADAIAKDKARRPRGGHSPNPPGATRGGHSDTPPGATRGRHSPTPPRAVPPESAPEGAELWAELGAPRTGKKGESTMTEVLRNQPNQSNTRASEPVFGDEEEGAPQVAVGAVSVFTNGVVVAQHRGTLTNQPLAPQMQAYQPPSDYEESARPAVPTTDDETNGGISNGTHQTVSGYTASSRDAAIEALKMIEEKDEVPWFKSSEFRCCFCCVLIAAIIGAVVGVKLGSGDDDPVAPVATPAPIAKNTDSPTSSPTVTPLDPDRVIAARQAIIGGEISSAISLDFPDTPQNAAYMWLLRDDEFTWSGAVEGGNVLLNRYLLATFYYALEGPGWRGQEGWLDPFVSHCEWQHVTCDAEGDVTRIFTGGRPGDASFAGSNNMIGPIPREIVHFTKLDQLRLQGNWIMDISALGQGLPLLKIFDIGGNPLSDFSGLLGMPNVETISLRQTQQGGNIPSEFFQLSNLLAFDLSNNEYTGTLTTEFGNFRRLRDVSIAGNDLEGDISTIFESIQDRSLIRTFDFDHNSLSGSLPAEILSDFGGAMQTLALKSNQITGTLPTEFGDLRMLIVMQLSGNSNISGTLPSEIGQMNSLRDLLLDGAFLEGTIPTEYGNLLNLRRLNIAGTLISGTTDERLCAIQDLTIQQSPGLDCTCPRCTM